MDEKLKSILNEIGQQPLRSSVITAGAFIDTMLAKLLKKYLLNIPQTNKMFEANGPLSTFSAKISMAHALGLISSELAADIDLFRKIRNKCAHELALDNKQIHEIKGNVGNFKLIRNTSILGESKDVQARIGLEVALIFFCLIKRLENVEQVEAYPFEIHDNYLAFSDEENRYITDFTSKMKDV